jgi:hypothetical protein
VRGRSGEAYVNGKSRAEAAAKRHLSVREWVIEAVREKLGRESAVAEADGGR